MDPRPTEVPRAYVTRDRAKPPRADSWRPRPLRLLAGLSLIVIGTGWLALDATVWAPKAAPVAVVMHGPVGTAVQMVDRVRARPILSQQGEHARATVVRVSFHNVSHRARILSPGDVRLSAGGRLWPNVATGGGALRRVTLPLGAYVTADLRFDTGVVPGAALVYTPSWRRRVTLRWLLWR